MSPLIPLLCLILGALALLFGLLPGFRYTGTLAIASAAAAFIAVVLMAFDLPARAILSAWRPALLLPVGLALAMDALAWFFAASVLALTLATLLTGVARPGGRRVLTRVAMLLLAAAGLASITAESLLTRAVAWAALDLVYFLALILLAEADGLEPQAVLNLAFNSAGTLLAIAAALMISRTSASLSLRDAVLTPQSTLLITLAAVFRLGLFPLHLGLPADINIRQGLGTMLRLVPAAVALETVSRLAAFGFAAPVRPWFTVFGVAAALAGAAQLWNADDPRRGLAYVVIAQSGLVLMGGLWGAANAGTALTMTAQTLALTLGGALVFLANGHEPRRPWMTALPMAGAAALMGLPLTIGFVGLGNLYIGLLAVEGVGWIALAGIFIAQAMLGAGLLNVVLETSPPLEAVGPTLVAYVSGLGLPAVFVVLAALLTGLIGAALDAPATGLLGISLGNPYGWVALVLSLASAAASFVLWRFQGAARDRSGLTACGLASLARLDWLYRLVWRLIRDLGSLVRNLAGVLEGEGAVLWTLVAAVLIWLLFR